MASTRRVFGWLIAALGGIGILASLAAIVGVWIVAQRIRDTVDNVVTTVTGVTTEVRNGSDQVTAWAAGAADDLTALRTRTRDRVGAAARVDPARLEETTHNLRTLLARGRQWVAVARSTRELVGLFSQIVDSVRGAAGARERDELRTTLATGLAQIDDASRSLEELATAIEDLRSDPEAPPTPRLVRILERCTQALAHLQEHSRSFSETLKRIESAAIEFGGEIKFKVAIASVAVTLLLVWSATAQWCLAAWGLRLRSAGRETGTVSPS